MLFSLYLHFPFCARKCAYCDFCSFPADAATVEAYCRALRREIELAAPLFRGDTADTVFLGGGTPSLVPPALMDEVLRALRRNFAIAPDAEFTSEANPGTLREDWLDAAQAAGLNRLSVGVQAKQERLLRALGRIHDFPQALEALALAKQRGVGEVNADAMFGLPGQTLDDYLDTLDALCGAGVTHLSAYSLILEEGTPLMRGVSEGTVVLPGDEAVAEMLESGVERLRLRGYERYEISNFARPGHLCRHNLGYWSGKRYLGLGLNAASLLPATEEERAGGALYTRASNTDSLPEYLRRLGGGELPRASAEPIDRDEARYERLMLGLRTAEGVDCADFERDFGVSLEALYGARIAALTAEGCVRADRLGRLALTDHGLNVQSAVLLRLTDGL